MMKKRMVCLLLLIFSGTASAYLSQGNYRWRSDTVGLSTNSGWLAAQNGNIANVAVGSNIRLRMEVYQPTSDGSSGDRRLKLYYSTSSNPATGTWTQVTTGSAVFQLSSTSYFADQDENDADFLDESGGTSHATSGNTSGGEIGPHAIESSAQSGIINVLQWDSYEMEYCIKPTASAVAGQTYYFKFRWVWDDGSGEDNLENYASLPALTMATNAAPTITSNGGGSTASVNVPENTTAVTDVQSTDDSDSEGSGLTYSLTGGADQALFGINSSTGILTFDSAPDYESPGDDGGNNVYDVQVTVTDAGALTDVQDIAVTVTNAAEITFADGSGFTPAITRGSANQALGRFQLTGDVSGASLTAASIRLNGTRTGLSNLKLWSSVDETFESGSDTQIGSTVTGDPGDGNSAAFSGFSSAVGTGGVYYFISGDIASDVAGVVQGVIVENASLTLNSGTLLGSISNAPLSNGDASLPVGLLFFSARCEGASVILNWTTESETDNLGFILEKSLDRSVWTIIASYRMDDALRSQGNTSSAADYTFTDTDVLSGETCFYRLSDVDTDGNVTVLDVLAITLAEVTVITDLLPATPNPFNPSTQIQYTLAEAADVHLSVVDMMGRTVQTIISGQNHAAGSHSIHWNGKTGAGENAASGIYLLVLKAGQVRKTQKVMLVR